MLLAGTCTSLFLVIHPERRIRKSCGLVAFNPPAGFLAFGVLPVRRVPLIVVEARSIHSVPRPNYTVYEFAFVIVSWPLSIDAPIDVSTGCVAGIVGKIIFAGTGFFPAYIGH